MFAKLPELLGRNFAIAFFLPMSAFLAANYFFLTSLELVNRSGLDSFAKQEPWLATTIVVFLNWLGGVFLLASNRLLLRFKEGYGFLQNPRSPLLLYQKWRLARLKSSIEKVDQEIDEHERLGEAIPPDFIRREIRLHRRLAEEFPDRDEFVLPTAFGNTIRAFETYPRRMYGVSAVRGWSRLIAVIPDEFLARLESSKTQMDFWVNLWFLAVVFALEDIYMAVPLGSWSQLWSALACTIAATFFSRLARTAAAGWGELVCGSFDVFLPALKRALEFDRIDGMGEREIWLSFSRAVVYRNPAFLPRPGAIGQGTRRTTDGGDDVMKIDPEGWYTAAEAARELKLSTSTVTRFARESSPGDAKKAGTKNRWYIKGSKIIELSKMYSLPGNDDVRPPKMD